MNITRLMLVNSSAFPTRISAYHRICARQVFSTRLNVSKTSMWSIFTMLKSLLLPDSKVDPAAK